MDDLYKHALSGIDRLEYELIICDFTSVLNDGSFSQLGAFLDPDVVYRPSLRQAVRGSAAVIEMCRDISAQFDVWRTSLINVAGTGDVVLAEQLFQLKLPSAKEQWVMGLASFRLTGCLISEWRQIHA